MNEKFPNDGGPVASTGGGKWGSPGRWLRPSNMSADYEGYSAVVLVGGIGPSVHRRRGLMIELLVADKGGWHWLARAPNAVRRIEQRSGQADSLAEAKSAALSAARGIAIEAEGHPRESPQHPPVGPIVWPGKP